MHIVKGNAVFLLQMLTNPQTPGSTAENTAESTQLLQAL